MRNKTQNKRPENNARTTLETRGALTSETTKRGAQRKRGQKRLMTLTLEASEKNKAKAGPTKQGIQHWMRTKSAELEIRQTAQRQKRCKYHF